MRRVAYFAGLLLLVAGISWAVVAWSNWRTGVRTAKLNVDVENLFVGLQQYKEYVGTYPSGNNAEIVKAMLGQNPKNLIILVGRKSDLNSKGEMVDPWGTPLRIYFSANGILIRSAGPNRRFDDSTAVNCDDYFRSN
jgi:hypothetical protein